MSAQQTRPVRVPPAWFVHVAWRVRRLLYQLAGGRFLWTPSNKRGGGALRLTTSGRRSGRARSVIVGYLEDGPDVFALAINGWQEGHPAWWLNLQADPDAIIQEAHQKPRPFVHTSRPERNTIGCGSALPPSNRTSTPTPTDGRPKAP